MNLTPAESRAIAQDAFFKALYGSHPYAAPPEGTAASLAAQVTEAFKAALQPDVRESCVVKLEVAVVYVHTGRKTEVKYACTLDVLLIV